MELLGLDMEISKFKPPQRSLEDDLKYIFGDNLLPAEKDQSITTKKSARNKATAKNKVTANTKIVRMSKHVSSKKQ